MPDSEAKKRWIKENTKIITFKTMKKGDADILNFLSTHPTTPTIKKALREYMANHPEEMEETNAVQNP